MTATLIIKSASLERLDALVEHLRSGGGIPGNADLLTHPHWLGAIAENYPELTPVAYPHAGGFVRPQVALLKGNVLRERYDRVIVLVSNLSGAGHQNVLDAASVFGGEIFLFNVNSEMKQVSPGGLRMERIRRMALFPVVVSGTLLVGLVVGGILAPLLALRFIPFLTTDGTDGKL